MGADTRSHLIRSAKTRTGMGPDAPEFAALPHAAWHRHYVRHVLADAGFDAEANHELARHEYGVRSLIKAGVGRPSARPAGTGG